MGKRFLLFLFLTLVVASCSRQVVVQPPRVDTRVDTFFVVLPPPPPVVIPADSTELVLDMDLLCDSLWRAQHPVVLPPLAPKRLSAWASISQRQVKFSCREDSLLVLLDSIRTYAIRAGERQTYYEVEYRCPYGWPKVLHLVVIVAFVLCLILTLIVSLKRWR